MLRIIQSSSASRAKSYFSTADYYTQGQELVGYWHGKGADRLGLAGVIKRTAWDRLCDNRHPETGLPLTARRKNERRVGYDFNFHCPKSVSILYAMTQDERILSAFRDSVGATMLDIEAEAKARVRSRGRNEDRTTGNLAWGEYVHFTARPVDGVPDPHLHAHCFVFNATYDANENRWKAGQFGDIKRDAPYFEAVFHSRFARRLEELGLETERTATGWELVGIAPETLTKFSRRTTQIEKVARERGITDPKLKAEIGAQTRSSKQRQVTMHELQALWGERMTRQEAAGVKATAKCIGRSAIAESDRAGAEAVERAMHHCFERASVVPERTLLTDALKRGAGKASREAVEHLMESQPLVRATRAGRRMVTTREVLGEEARMLAFAREGRGACRPINPNRVRFHREWLGKEQQAAVRHVLESRDRVTLIRGVAGTGKTTMMEEAREAVEEAGMHVLAFAPSAGASRGELRKAGFAKADTVARLLLDEELQAEAKDGVLWIDEAGLVGTRTMCRVFDLAERLHARVVLSGDRKQHGSVERGAALRLLEEEAGLQPAELKEIQRQRDQYKAAVKHLSEGRTEEGFRRLDALGWIKEVGEEERYRALADVYIESLQAKHSALVVAPTHAEGERITAEIRRQLRGQGLLGKASHEFSRLLPANLTLGEREDPASYKDGDVLVFHQNAKGYKIGDVLVAGHDPLPLTQAARFSVYRQSQVELSPGDRIRITRNGLTRDGKHGLNNGDLYVVRGFTLRGDLVVRDVDERKAEREYVIAKDYGHLTHGFTVTSYGSQGKTVNRVFIAQSAMSYPASSREQWYVSVSRGRDQVTVFTDDKEALLEAVSRSDDRVSGTELVRGLSPVRHRVIRERLAEQERHHRLMRFERDVESEVTRNER